MFTRNDPVDNWMFCSCHWYLCCHRAIIDILYNDTANLTPFLSSNTGFLNKKKKKQTKKGDIVLAAENYRNGGFLLNLWKEGFYFRRKVIVIDKEGGLSGLQAPPTYPRPLSHGWGHATLSCKISWTNLLSFNTWSSFKPYELAVAELVKIWHWSRIVKKKLWGNIHAVALFASVYAHFSLL